LGVENMLRMLTVTIFAVATLSMGLHRATACDESAKRAQLTEPESAQSELLLARDDDSGDDDDNDDDDDDDDDD